MGWFSKRSKTLVPREVLDQLGPFGRAAWESKVSSRPITDPRFDWTNFFSKVLPAYQSNLTKAIAEIHAAAGDDPFAKYGGYRLVAEFEPATKDPRYLEMMDACLQMMYERGLSSGHMTGFEQERWVETHGDIRTSFDRIVEVNPPESRTVSVNITVGHSLMVAKMGPNPLDNEFWIERIDDNSYRVFSMRQWDSDAVTLTRSEEESIGTSNSADGILRKLANYLGLPSYWSHEELQSYFPVRRNL